MAHNWAPSHYRLMAKNMTAEAAPAKASAKASAAATPPQSFEQAMAELAQLVTQMESGALPLEASVAAYARGSELVKYCAAQLEKVESQVKVLEGDMLKPFSSDEADQ